MNPISQSINYSIMHTADIIYNKQTETSQINKSIVSFVLYKQFDGSLNS